MLATRKRRVVAAVAVAVACAGCTKVDVPPGPSASIGPTSPSSTSSTNGSPGPGTGTGVGDPTPPAPASPTATPSPTGTPVSGGVLRIVSGADSGGLDAATTSPGAQNILRGLSRQLVSYQPGRQFTDVVGRVVADAAAQVPLPVNGTSYTFTIRAGIAWDLPTPRPVTSADFARGIKRLCSPVGGSYVATYFVDTVAGYADFCAGFAKLGRRATPALLKAYLETHAVVGLQSPDPQTLVVTLKAPAGDFLNMMALPAASATPLEALSYLPGSPEAAAHFVSDGPYEVRSYQVGKSLTLGRSAAWTADSDPIRKAYADEVQVSFGFDEQSALAAVNRGDADVANDLAVPAVGAAVLGADPQLAAVTDGASQYVVVNTRSGAGAGALRSVGVRQALNLAVDKARIVALAGGPDVAQPLNTVLTPQLLGYRPTDRYRTPGDAGDLAGARQLLATAGMSSGLTLRLLYGTGGSRAGTAGGGPGGVAAIAAAIRDSWHAVGITARLVPVDDATLARTLAGPSTGWDVALAPAWRPDWYGSGARTIFTPLLRSGAARNYGRYSDGALDALIAAALAEPDGNRAGDIWSQADATVMRDAPWIPLFTARRSFLRGDRVRGWSWSGLGLPDYPDLWLG